MYTSLVGIVACERERSFMWVMKRHFSKSSLAASRLRRNNAQRYIPIAVCILYYRYPRIVRTRGKGAEGRAGGLLRSIIAAAACGGRIEKRDTERRRDIYREREKQRDV